MKKGVIKVFKKIVNWIFKGNRSQDPFQFQLPEKKRNLISFDGYVGYTGIGKVEKAGKDMHVFYIAFPQKDEKTAKDKAARMVLQIKNLSAFHKYLKFSKRDFDELIKRFKNLSEGI